MNFFVERLPWRLAALAGLIVGAVSAVGGTDIWQCLLRIGEAFAAFAALGLLLRAALRPFVPPNIEPQTPKPSAAGDNADEIEKDLTG